MVSQKLSNNNVFTIAKRNVEGQDMLYQSIKLTNGIWCLAELKMQPGNNSVTVSARKIKYSAVEFSLPFLIFGLIVCNIRASVTSLAWHKFTGHMLSMRDLY